MVGGCILIHNEAGIQLKSFKQRKKPDRQTDRQTGRQAGKTDGQSQGKANRQAGTCTNLYYISGIACSNATVERYIRYMTASGYRPGTLMQHAQHACLVEGEHDIPATEACLSEMEAAAEASLEPMAMPTSAAAKAAISLMPSPQYMHVLPKPYTQSAN